MLVRQQMFLVTLFIFLLGSVTSAIGEDHYYSIDVGELKFVEGKLPARPGEGWTCSGRWQWVFWSFGRPVAPVGPWGPPPERPRTALSLLLRLSL